MGVGRGGAEGGEGKRKGRCLGDFKEMIEREHKKYTVA